MKPPIFICGTGRSGTTIFQQCLIDHPAIWGLRYESRFLVSPGGLFDLLDAENQPSALERFRTKLLGEWYRRVFRRGTEHAYEAGLFVDVNREYLEGIVERFENEYRKAGDRSQRLAVSRHLVDAVFAPGIEASGAHRFVEKTPANLAHLGHLYELYPDARFVQVIRDGRDVVASILERGFWPVNPRLVMAIDGSFPKTVENGAIYWRAVLRHGRRLAANLPADRYLEIRLERLLESPDSTFRLVCKHIEESYDPRLEKRLDPSRAHRGRWREAFSPQDEQAFLEIAGDLLSELGYGRR